MFLVFPEPNPYEPTMAIGLISSNKDEKEQENSTGGYVSRTTRN
jgi:hypothetical protein